MANQVEKKSKAELAEMHTGTLMARRKALLECDESLEMSDKDEGYQHVEGIIEFKNTPEWKQAYADLKGVLSSRENVLNKQQRKEARQMQAKEKK